MDYPDLFMNNYALVHNDRLDNDKSYLSMRGLKISRLNEGLILEIKVNEESIILFVLCRSLS